MGKVIDLLGLTYNRLTVTGRALNNEQKRAMWFCSCVCGNETVVESDALRSGNTKSCGCLHQEQIEAHVQNCWKHGHSPRNKPHPLYRAWGRARATGTTKLEFLDWMASKKDIRAASRLT